MRSLISSLLLTLTAPMALAADAPLLVPGADGTELIDRASGLAWSRCVEGLHWDGKRCAGEPRLATHAEALALARERSAATGTLWRVPRVVELKRFADRLAHGGDAALAPAAPGGPYWTSTVRIESEAVNLNSYRAVERGATERQVNTLSVQQGWAVELPGGVPRGVAKREKLPVRLVRALDAEQR
jgi:hypothetical protein